jgi:hypothetical protein
MAVQLLGKSNVNCFSLGYSQFPGDRDLITRRRMRTGLRFGNGKPGASTAYLAVEPSMSKPSVVTIAELRAAVSAKIRRGITRRTISLVIIAYVPPGRTSGRQEEGVRRLPLELIPIERRNEFLLELAHLQPEGILSPSR